MPLLDLPVAARADHRRAVAEDHRAHAEIIVDQPVAIDVMKIGAFAALEDERRRRHAEAEVRRDPPGQKLRGTSYLSLRFLEHRLVGIARVAELWGNGRRFIHQVVLGLSLREGYNFLCADALISPLRIPDKSYRR